ncbi:hypothetical protein CGMCC3_g12978 [Colletotrichum fructicola]|nr:uncharacterized protein CGMCC3_g12978 [Colletotrichum fructicola]KAE9571034.1 hypothetical protein CGMCC3_g12978 [Colletotrichum fructicola]
MRFEKSCSTWCSASVVVAFVAGCTHHTFHSLAISDYGNLRDGSVCGAVWTGRQGGSRDEDRRCTGASQCFIEQTMFAIFSIVSFF